MTVSINGSGGITYPDGSVNTTRSVSTAGDTITGPLTLNMSASGSGQTLSINSGTPAMLQLKQKPGGSDHAYIEYYPRSASAARGAYVGFGGAGVIDFDIINETSGNVVIGNNASDKCLVLSNGGLRFPASQIAHSNANTLDDYEEGFWSPFSGTTNVSISLVSGAVNNAVYTRIGRLVNAYCYVNVQNNTGANSAYLIAGLPFACSFGYGPINHYYGTSMNTGTANYIESGAFYGIINDGTPTGSAGQMFHFSYFTV